MRVRQIFLAFTLCALPHILAAAATDGSTDVSDGFADCEMMYLGDEAARAPEYHVPALRPVAVPTPLGMKERNALETNSYADVYNILKEDNSCSRFFGGPMQAVEVFNELARRLKKKALDNRDIAVRMSGNFETFFNAQTGAQYRIFEEATVNSNGPLLRRPASERERERMRVGRFPSGTRQARALMFLHEVGHLVPRAGGGGWVLPNDGDNLRLSDKNTKTVEENCIEQLTALK